MFGILSKKFPHYLKLLSEKKTYEEVSKLSDNCVCVLFFHQKKHEELKLLSFTANVILETWNNDLLKYYTYTPTTIYREVTKYHTFERDKNVYCYSSSMWERNGREISQYDIPLYLLRKLKDKKPCQTVYTSEPIEGYK